MERAEAAQRYDLGAPPAELPAEVAAALEGDPPFALALERVRAARRNDPDARARIDAWNRGQDRPPVDMAALRCVMFWPRNCRAGGAQGNFLNQKSAVRGSRNCHARWCDHECEPHKFTPVSFHD